MSIDLRRVDGLWNKFTPHTMLESVIVYVKPRHKDFYFPFDTYIYFCPSYCIVEIVNPYRSPWSQLHLVRVHRTADSNRVWHSVWWRDARNKVHSNPICIEVILVSYFFLSRQYYVDKRDSQRWGKKESWVRRRQIGLWKGWNSFIYSSTTTK